MQDGVSLGSHRLVSKASKDITYVYHALEIPRTVQQQQEKQNDNIAYNIELL